MKTEKIIEIARRFDPDEPDFVMTEDTLIAFAQSVIEAERDNIEVPFVRVPIEVFSKLREHKVSVSDLAKAIKQVKAERETRKLTDEEIGEIVREASSGSALRRDGSTSLRIARAIERRINREEE